MATPLAEKFSQNKGSPRLKHERAQTRRDSSISSQPPLFAPLNNASSVDSLAVVTHGQTQILTRVADVGSGVVTDVETLDVLSDGVDDTDGLVTGDEGELGHELSLVDVLVGSADTTEGDYGSIRMRTGKKREIGVS